MKKLILIIIALSFVSVCFAWTIQDAHRAAIARKNVDAAPAEIIPDTIDERFETTSGTACLGYDYASFRGNCLGGTIDEDYATSSVPAGDVSSWDSSCAYLASASGDSIAWNSDEILSVATTYTRIEINIDSESLSNTNECWFLQSYTTGYDMSWYLKILDQAGTLKFSFEARTNGTDTVEYISSIDVSLDTMYRIEVLWDSVGDVWEWRIDGATEDSGALTGGAATESFMYFYFGKNNCDANVQYYLDNLGLDDDEWIGASQ